MAVSPEDAFADIAVLSASQRATLSAMAAQEQRIITEAVAEYNARTLTPEAALAAVGGVAAMHRLRASLRQQMAAAVAEVESEVERGEKAVDDGTGRESDTDRGDGPASGQSDEADDYDRWAGRRSA